MKRLLKKFYYALEGLKNGDLLKRNETLKGIHEGKRCFILGSGASLNELDLKKLENEYSFGSNFIFNHTDCLPPTFYTMIERPSTMMKISKRDVPFASDYNPENYFKALESYLSGRKTKIFLHRGCKK